MERNKGRMILAAIIPALMLSSLMVIVTPAAAAEPASMFFDNFDGVDKGWTHSGFWNEVENPQNLAISAQINPRLVHLPDNGYLPSAYSDGKCYWYGEASTGTFIGSDFDPLQYNASGGTSTAANEGWLVSPSIDLSGLTSAYLSFETWWEIEGVDVNVYDMMTLSVNVSGGSSYYIGAINPLNDVNGESWKPYSSAGLGAPGVWQNVKVNLSDYAGGVVNIAFFFETRDNLYNGFRGWLIDDVSVLDGALPPVTLSAASPGAGGVGKKVTVQGLNFCIGAEVEIGGIQALDVSVISSEKLEFLVPYGLAVGNYAINVTNPGGSKVTLPNAFQVTDVLSPIISSVVPVKAGTDTSFVVNVTGSYFSTGCSVQIASTACEILETTSTYVVAKAPSGLPVGYQNLKLTNPDTQFDLVQGAILVQPLGYAPTGLTTTLSSGKVDLNWIAPANMGTIVSYEVYKGTTMKGMTLLKSVTGTSCSDTDVMSGATYYYSVLATNSTSIKSAMSSIASAIPYTVPDAPTGLTATAGNARVTLNWIAPVSDGGSAIDYYIVYQDGVALPGHPTGLTATITGLSNGQSYSFKVAAHNLAGIGAQSSAASAKPEGGGGAGLDPIIIVGVIAALAVVAAVAFLVIRSRARGPKLGTTPGGGSGQGPPAMSSCPQCGTPLAPGTTFCANCGRKLG